MRAMSQFRSSAMYKGDFARNQPCQNTIRLPSCLDNRPLKFEEWEIFVRKLFLFLPRLLGNWDRPVGF